MTKQPNQPNPFLAIYQSLQAREILVALEKHGCMGNDQLFYHWLGTLGLGPSHRDLDDLLDKLEKEGLISSEKIEKFRVVRLTRAGIEIAQGRTGIDWIARVDLG